MSINIPHHNKYKFNLEYKTIYNFPIPYIIAIVVTGLEISYNLENK